MIKKVLIWTLLFALFSLFVPIGQHGTINAATKHPKITANRNHVLADVDEVVDLTQIDIEGDFGKISLSDGSLSSLDPAITITQTTVSINAVGVFPVLFSYQETQMTLYFITKLESDTEYVIYEQDFSGMANGAVPAEFHMYNNLGQPGGSAAINNERLMLSPMTIVLFPTYLSGFTNYVIETDMRMSAATASSRWTSVMFRYSTENYFQMAIRQDASAANGVEFAKRMSGSWNVPKTASFTEALDPATTYGLKVDVNGSHVKEYINDSLLIDYDAAYEFTHGRIGVQADNVTAYYDNIRITLPVDYVEGETYDFAPVVEVYQPETGIVAPATVLSWFNSSEQIADLQETIRPATYIFRINDDLDIVDQAGTVLMPLLDLLDTIDGTIIPAFYTTDVAVATNLAEQLKVYRIFDSFILSEDANVILEARKAHSLIRGILNFPMNGITSLSNEDLMDVREQTNKAQAVASIIPAHLLDQEKVFYMQKRLMTVWVSTEDTDMNQYQAILSGANGIVTQDYESLYDKYEQFTKTTHVRRPLMIAHRGLYAGGSSLYPENTIEGGLESIKHGADIIELDVHLTLDWEVVVIHDGTTARTAPDYPSHTVASTVLEDLLALTLDDPNGNRDDLKIPTLRQFLEAFKDTDVVIFIEIKPTQQLLVQAVADIINELDMYDQSVVITFSAANIIEMNTVMPEMANGHLTSSVLNAQSDETSLSNTFTDVIPINSTLNPYFGPLTDTFIQSIVHRGITIWPWTIDEYNQLVQYYNYGVGGITTNQLSYFDNTFNRISFDSTQMTFLLEEAVGKKVTSNIETQTGTSYPLSPEYIIIDDGGTGIVLDDDGTIASVEQTGTLSMYTTFDSTMPNGTDFSYTSDIILIHIVLPEAQTSNTLAIVLISIGSASLLAGGSFFLLKYLKIRKLTKI